MSTARPAGTGSEGCTGDGAPGACRRGGPAALDQTTDSRMQDSIRERVPFMDPLASVLQRALPTGSSVSVRWKEANGGMVASDCGDVQVSLRDTADALIGGVVGGQP